MTQLKEWYSVPETAELYGLSTAAIYRMIALGKLKGAGRLPGTRAGTPGDWRIPADTVARMVEPAAPKPTREPAAA